MVQIYSASLALELSLPDRAATSTGKKELRCGTERTRSTNLNSVLTGIKGSRGSGNLYCGCHPHQLSLTNVFFALAHDQKQNNCKSVPIE